MSNNMGKDILFAFYTKLIVKILKKEISCCCSSHLGFDLEYVKLQRNSNITPAWIFKHTHDIRK